MSIALSNFSAHSYNTVNQKPVKRRRTHKTRNHETIPSLKVINSPSFSDLFKPDHFSDSEIEWEKRDFIKKQRERKLSLSAPIKSKRIFKNHSETIDELLEPKKHYSSNIIVEDLMKSELEQQKKQKIEDLISNLSDKHLYIIEKSSKEIGKFLSLKGYCLQLILEEELLIEAAELIQSENIEEVEFDFYINFEKNPKSSHQKKIATKNNRKPREVNFLSWVKA